MFKQEEAHTILKCCQGSLQPITPVNGDLSSLHFKEQRGRILEALLDEEVSSSYGKKILEGQPLLIEKSRRVILEWLNDNMYYYKVQSAYPIVVQYFDRYISLTPITKETDLYIIICACLYIATPTYIETCFITEDFLRMLGGHFSFKEMLEKVDEILETLGYKLQDPNVCHFFKLIENAGYYLGGLPEDFFKKALELFIIGSFSSEFARFLPSQQVAGIFLLLNAWNGDIMKKLKKSDLEVKVSAYTIVKQIQYLHEEVLRGKVIPIKPSLNLMPHFGLISLIQGEGPSEEKYELFLQACKAKSSNLKNPFREISYEEYRREFQVGNMIGSGSFANIYRGVSKEGIEVALKEISFDSCFYEKFESVLGELSYYQYLNGNENMLKVLEVLKTGTIGDSSNTPKRVLVLEMCSMDIFEYTETLLKDLPSRMSEIPNSTNILDVVSFFNKERISELKKIFRPVFEALHYMHEKGFTHGDISLSNILIRDGKGVLSDFGFLKRRLGLQPQLAYSPLCRDYGKQNIDFTNSLTDLFALGASIVMIFMNKFKGYYLDVAVSLLKLIDEQLYDLVRRLTSTEYSERLTAKECLEHPWWSS